MDRNLRILLGLGLSFFMIVSLLISPNCYGASIKNDSDPALHDEYINLLKLREGDKYDEIIEGMKGILQKDPAFWRAYQKIVEAFKAKKDLNSAIVYFQGLLDQNPENLYAYYGLGLAYRKKGDSKSWLENFRSGVETDPQFALIYETIRNDDDEEEDGVGEIEDFIIKERELHEDNPVVHYGLGAFYEYQRKWKKALESLDKAIKLDPDLIEAYRSKAAVCFAQSNAKELLNVSVVGLQLAENLNDIEYEAHFLGLIATAYYSGGDYSSALEYYNRALDISIQVGDKNAKRKYLGDLGLVYTELNNYTMALEYLEQALKISREISNKKGERIHLGNIGRLYARLRLYDRALQYLNEAVVIANKIKDEKGLATHLINTGFVYLDSGAPHKALKYLTQAQKIAEKLEDRRLEGYINIYIGSTELKRNNLHTALQFFNQALEIAQQIGERKLESHALNYLGITHRKLGNFAEAIRNHNQVLMQGETVKAIRAIWNARAGLAAVYEKQGKLQEACEEYKLAVQAIEGARDKLTNLEDSQKISFLHSKIQIYEKLNGLLAKLHRRDPLHGYDREAFQYVERAKARSMMDLLQDSKGQAEIKGSFIDVTAAQKQLDDKTILLEYALGKFASLLFAVTKNGFRMFPLQGHKIENLAKMVSDSAREPTSYSAYITYTMAAHKLYNLAVKPAEGMMKGKTQVVVVADGRLHYVPFAALLDRPAAINGSIDFDKLPYLIKKYSIRYVQSAGVLRSLNASRLAMAERRGFLGVSASPHGNQFQQQGYLNEGLLYSNLEVKQIAHLYTPSTLLEDPTRETILEKMRQVDYKGIHFAVCGIFDGKNPRLDLSCSEESKRGRYLNLDDILKLRLNTDLVVLAACQTGLGRDVKGEGVIGFSRAFIYAGASSVLVTLWNISDKTSPEFMIKFYKYLADHKKADALRLASLTMIKSKYAHPFYWAGFVLIGGDDPGSDTINKLK